MSMARRVLPSKLELNSCEGSGRLAPWANVSFTTFVYVSPVQTIPLCDQTGIPAIEFDGFRHFRSSIMSGSASRISDRMRARVSSRQSVSDLAWADDARLPPRALPDFSLEGKFSATVFDFWDFISFGFSNKSSNDMTLMVNL